MHLVFKFEQILPKTYDFLNSLNFSFFIGIPNFRKKILFTPNIEEQKYIIDLYRFKKTSQKNMYIQLNYSSFGGRPSNLNCLPDQSQNIGFCFILAVQVLSLNGYEYLNRREPVGVLLSCSDKEGPDG